MIELFSFDFRNGGPRLLAAGFRSLAFLFFSTNRKRRLLWNVTFFFVLHSVDQSMMNIMRKKGKRALFFTKKELFNGSRSDLGDRWNMSALPDFCCGSFFLFVVEAFHFHCVYWSPLFICVLFFFGNFRMRVTMTAENEVNVDEKPRHPDRTRDLFGVQLEVNF